MKINVHINRTITLLMALVMLSCLLPSTAMAANEYIITTAAELDTVVRNNLSGNFKLGNDIDLSTYPFNSSTWRRNYGWSGIGSTQARAFTGTFDGNGYTISGLWNYSCGSNQGLFGWLSGATIKNLNIELSIKGMSGTERIGALAGNAFTGTTIENINVVGSRSSINGSANYAAGLVGVLYKSSIASSSVTNVAVSGSSYVAGLAGTIYGASTITDCDVTDANITATSSYAGGLVGYSYESSKITGGSVNNAYVYSGGSYAGGFIGASKSSTIERSYVMGGTVASNASYAGGFSGAVYDKSNLTSCYVFDGDVSAKHYAGGHMGTVYGYSTVQKSCVYGNARTTSAYIAGGFAGEATNASIANCYAQVNVVSKTSDAGGFIAYAAGSTSVYNCYAAGSVSARSKTNVGAFVGHATVTFLGTNYYDKDLAGNVSACSSSGTKSGHTSSYPRGKDTATMKKQATFVGWDFATTWRIDENLTYPYFWDWGWWIKTATISYDKNSEDATGTMADLVVEKGVAAKLEHVEFVYSEHGFLGWSTSPDGDVEYQDCDTVTFDQDTTLYAIWGEPDLSFGIVTDKDSGRIGETISCDITLGNNSTDYSSTWYGVYIELTLSEYVELSGVRASLNGSQLTPIYSYDTAANTVRIELGDLESGMEYFVSVAVLVLPDGANEEIEFGYSIDGKYNSWE